MPIARWSTGPKRSGGKAHQAEAIRAYMLAHWAKKRPEDAQLRRREDVTSTAKCSKPKKTTRATTQSSPPNPSHRAKSTTGPTLNHAAATR
jgi:hypothetical protein